MKTKSSFLKISLLVLLLLPVVFSCNNVKKDWEKAKQQNTIETYNNFIAKYPKSEYAEDAKQKKLELEYSWKDGFLDKEYKEYPAKVQQALSMILNEENSIIVGMKNIKNGSLMTFLGSPTGVVEFTSNGTKGGMTITVKSVYINGTNILGFKVNEGDRDASLHLHQTIQKNMKQKNNE